MEKGKKGSFSVKTYFDLLEGGSQQSVPIKMLWNPIFPLRWDSSLEKFGGVKFSPWISLKREVSPWLAGALFVERMKNL